MFLAAIAFQELYSNGFYIEYLQGCPYNFKNKLEINQKDKEKISFSAEYDSEPLIQPYYYSVKIGKGKLELELLHHKLYLKNKPEEIERFHISHGYNVVTINRQKNYKKIIIFCGAGTVISHPENRVRNKKLNEKKGIMNTGYYINGISAQVGIKKKKGIKKGLYLNTEFKYLASHSRVPVHNGEAEVIHFSLHFLLGIGYKF